MTSVHNLGFPRIGAARELKFACESYWREESNLAQLKLKAQQLKLDHWQAQLDAGVDWLPVGDFSFYDHVLDTSYLVGNLPSRFSETQFEASLDLKFAVARGIKDKNGDTLHAAEMTKWFNTNYHYLVPELSAETEFSLHADDLLEQIEEARKLSSKLKPVILGPLSYLWLGKIVSGEASNTFEGANKLALLKKLLPVYKNLIATLAEEGISWLQIDEPILSLDLPVQWQQAFESAYHQLQTRNLNILVASYFGPLEENLNVALALPVAALHFDAVYGNSDLRGILDKFPPHKILSLGVIDGRNIWKSDLSKLIEKLKPFDKKLKDRLWIAPSCSLLHVPIDLNLETKLDGEIKNWLAFAQQKLEELQILKIGLQTPHLVEEQLSQNQLSIAARKNSDKIHNTAVSTSINDIDKFYSQRSSDYPTRADIQREKFQLPLFPTTTIGSFPQTNDIRIARRKFKEGEIKEGQYREHMQSHIRHTIDMQQQLGLDVLVHGEAERNDMVEYFGEQLEGYTFTQFAWVQSYGSRCVKPPIIYGDVYRPHSMTVDWTSYAQSVSHKPVKGMLTGPITMLQWAFVRDDQTKEITAKQIALALREEVLELEQAGIQFIQVDEPALREGLPLRKKSWDKYLSWAVEAFKIATCGVHDGTQIHTHMCYAEFNDIIEAIAALDADVITIETSRSNMELLQAFEDFQYPNGIGPGVYDIHSPNIPNTAAMLHLIQKAQQYIPAQQLWVNPDCGLKTRNWAEVLEALENMVSAARQLRTDASQAA